MNSMKIMDASGDRTLSWEPGDKAATERANAEFNRLVQDGWLGSRMLSQGEGEQIRAFDPNAREIVMSPAIISG